MASSSACSLSKSLTGRAPNILAIKHKEVKHSITGAVSGPSASQLRAEAAALCRRASVHSKQSSKTLVSEFWNKESQDYLGAKSSSVKASNLTSGLSCPVVTARLFGPAVFEASKLRVLFLGSNKEHPDRLPRIYTLTHSDVTSKITLAVSREINKAQLKGWYSKLQRDEVLAEWKRVRGTMSLHVHCHISGGNFLHNIIANLRFYIFRKELPVVLEAFRHGDEELLKEYPDLDEALVWVYFHSNVEAYNRVECWGPLVEAAKSATEEAKEAIHHAMDEIEKKWPQELWPGKVCTKACECCTRHGALIPLPETFKLLQTQEEYGQQYGQEEAL
ncbi:hypothetical protein BDL97_01G096700 [Sphagnum fallax]|uniref:Staygreen protein domain-containing protein n=1 Tax=Sphagnum jensenii TaxID=128206 RepID=A0ABP0VLY1_9BRYO|nr:hypothetical protein BDL97_01G096700 [Sphagnum fallax]